MNWENILTVLFGTLIFLGSLVGMLSNGTALHYFSTNCNSSVFSKIFLIASATDFLTSFLSVFVAISYFLDREPGPFSDYTFNEIWGSLWNFVSRYSAYIVAVMSITRTARIVFPFRAIQSQLVIASLVLFGAWLVSTTPYFHGIPHYYKKEWCALALNKSQFIKTGSQDARYYLIVLAIPVLLIANIPLVFVSASVSFIKIYTTMRLKKVVINKAITSAAAENTRNNRGQQQRTGASRSTRKDSSVQSGITILCVVLIYLLLNIPYAGVYLYVQIISKVRSVSPAHVFTSHIVKKYIIGMTHVLSISLNAILNPVVLYLRMTSFKDHVDTLFSCTIFRRKRRARDRYRKRRGQLNKVILNKNTVPPAQAPSPMGGSSSIARRMQSV